MDLYDFPMSEQALIADSRKKPHIFARNGRWDACFPIPRSDERRDAQSQWWRRKFAALNFIASHGPYSFARR